MFMKEPLAARLRPNNLNEVIGQQHLINENSFLVNSIRAQEYFSIIFFGPPGTGKTSIAEAYAKQVNGHIIRMNATINTKKDIEAAILEARAFKPTPTFIIIDEIHRLNKDKQDILLPHLESGLFYLIGATTANPYISINKAIRSRCYLLEVKPLEKEDIKKGIYRALSHEDGFNNNFKLSDEIIDYIAGLAGGDMRYVINMLDVAYVTYINKDVITLEDVKSIFKGNYLQDKNEDDHYDNLSALQKSIRGSDVDAALFYLAKLCVAEDLISIERRLTVIAYEDVGFGNPSAVDRTMNALAAAKNVGFPEAIIPLGFAVCDLALSPKSRSSCDSMHRAMDFVRENQIPVQHYLRYTPVNVDEEDKYPYDRPDLWDKIQYLPDAISNMKFYQKEGTSKYDEALFVNYLKSRSIKRSNDLRKLKSKK